MEHVVDALGPSISATATSDVVVSRSETTDAVGGGNVAAAEPAAVEILVAMGFSADQAAQALEATGGNVELAAGVLLG